MTKPLASISTATTFRLTLVTGTPNFRHGLLTVVLESSGPLTLAQERSGKTSHYAKTRAPSRLAEVRKLLADLDITRTSAYKGPLVPGDTPLKVSVVIDGQPTLDTTFFSSDEENSSAINVLERVVEDLISDASDGSLHS